MPGRFRLMTARTQACEPQRTNARPKPPTSPRSTLARAPDPVAVIGQVGSNLAACATAYAAAVASCSVEAGCSNESSEQVLLTRLSLYRCLVDLNWTPPDRVLFAMAVDEDLLRESSR